VEILIPITNFTGSTNNKITKFTENHRLKLLFAYGVHAREFLPTESLLYLLKNLTQGLSNLGYLPLKHRQIVINAIIWNVFLLLCLYIYSKTSI
jgi:hypothetical protein